jgi:cytochrome c-type biogenesis protein CcmH
MARLVVPALLFLALISLALPVSAEPAGTQPGAVALESRLYAPCCYQGTLDVHDSELARELRKEIVDRLARGESSDSIQADFVERYGDRVLAARSSGPSATMGLSVVALSVAAAAMLAMLMRRRWSRRPGPRLVPATALRDGLDDRLDAELAELD